VVTNGPGIFHAILVNVTAFLRGDTVYTVLDYPQDGIRNGILSNTPGGDGIALVASNGTVVEFLSYEGSFVAIDGPAIGQSSVNIGVSEPPSTPAGQSLQRTSASTWDAPRTSSKGRPNN
jgi:hypothetical protein